MMSLTAPRETSMECTNFHNEFFHQNHAGLPMREACLMAIPASAYFRAGEA